MKITQNKITVERLLKQIPELRDNDRHLLVAVWQSELMKRGIDPIYFEQGRLGQFFALMQSGKLSNPESIRRTRQKLQETTPELRGGKYRARLERQKNVKEELGYNTGEQIKIFK